MQLSESSSAPFRIRDSTGGVVQADPGGTVWLQGTSVRVNEAVLPLVANTDYSGGDGSIFSDRDETVFFWTEDDTLEWRETGGLIARRSRFSLTRRRVVPCFARGANSVAVSKTNKQISPYGTPYMV